MESIGKRIWAIAEGDIAPRVVQRRWLDSRRAENALMSTIAYSED
jgi:hypothetical protein